jgi:head-tail adaptor
MAIVTGRLKSKVVFQVNQATPPSGGVGRITENYVDTLTRFGALRKITGRKGFEGLQLGLIGKWELIVRYESALINIVWKDMRVKSGTRLFMLDSAPDKDDEVSPAYLTFILNEKSSK